jgi:hypothetical protein
MNELLLPVAAIGGSTTTGLILPLLVGLLAGGLIAAGIVLLLVAVYVRRRPSATDRPPPHDGDAPNAGENVHELMEELDQLAGRIDQRIERRMAELKRLLAEADAEIARAEANIARANVRTGPKPPAGGSYEAVDAAPSISRNGPAEPLAARDERIDPRYEEILRLSGQGLDAIEIARRVEMNVGEVELVLNLHAPGQRAE